MEIRSLSALSVPKDGEEKIPAVQENGTEHRTAKQKEGKKSQKRNPEEKDQNEGQRSTSPLEREPAKPPQQDALGAEKG